MLFTFAGGTGHFVPLIPLAKAAGAAGHDVRFACAHSHIKLLTEEGFDVIPLGVRSQSRQPEAKPLLPLNEFREEQDFVRGFIGEFARSRFDHITELIESFRPELMVCDETDFGSIFAAESKGVLCATVIVLAAGSFPNESSIKPDITDLRKAVGLSASPAKRPMILAPFPQEFRASIYRQSQDCFSYCPPFESNSEVLTPDIFPTNPTWPLVYVTLGTVFNLESGDLFDRILKGVKDLPINFLVTCGADIDPLQFGDQPSNVSIIPFLNQSNILPHCRAMISHAGSGSTLGALLYGVPSVLIPMGADQPHNAKRCQDLGCAIVLDQITATPAQIRHAVVETLGNQLYRRASEEIMHLFRSLPDVYEVILRMERMSQ
jgi:UDP:flavonoid glycosyltransferase YjiC (YdhE family)